ncbi:DNA-processing protein DprA [Patescibacteria group bacterium]|nr:DNA-processing protein DprA [Patescibacteria group bacterium]MBU1970701.1 DNA-processing protein DprA [Patescibacteria group bacterium]
MSNYQVRELARNSREYPDLLKKVSGAPDPLYYLGDLKPQVFANTLAVVGSRAVTTYGEWVVNTIVKDMASCGISIVSGFMYGVDALAHRVALAAGGNTIAVMAGGINCIFPKYQKALYYDIAERGLIVSEYAGSSFGGGWMFARRNRIVAGLSYATLVVEAGEGSGSLITAKYAMQYGRPVWAVPGNLNLPNAYGTTQLLREGAKMLTCADDLLSYYFPTSNNYRQAIHGAVNKRLKLKSGDETSQKVLDALYIEPLTIDELTHRLHLSVEQILRSATGLCILGQVQERAGRYYVN